jgi:hypothetical protein
MPIVWHVSIKNTSDSVVVVVMGRKGFIRSDMLRMKIRSHGSVAKDAE